ncbi:GNAT family N-acetyltransferase [Microbacterium sp. KUDC0406]|uniref:GNAT family N-acetyltransferase n=1 Tax=Microbacterium sp. KUDC0406 TaxID=2909588 RepID=UPI001F1B97D9|nr:GNAT family N-acetyltransferase [Microbacterium sp. KUDC0406]UJP11000.1 GNAT family N-acetyltransferase [Microbacterium sp. KUDC0406]
MSFAVRRVAPGEWAEVRALRLRALADPVAHLAFLDTLEHASEQPEEFWQDRTRNAASGDQAAQFVAVSEDGDWFGTATVLDNRDRPGAGLVVGVYVADGYRGAGAIEGLFDAAATWAGQTGRAALYLEVHVDNHRAQRAYERCGFVRTGEITTLDNGQEYVMVRSLTTR